MDIGPVVRIPVLPGTGEVPRIEAAKLIRPELPAIAVAEPPPSPHAEPDPRRAPPSDAIERRVSTDLATGHVIVQAFDLRSGAPAGQVPVEVLLRLRAYERGLPDIACEGLQADELA
ncbi:hypothetical protein [Enterovirga rhinocerotis]|uniref:Uncharacterized protein n=1 Tax=Enterovirga rhinocerotis TaxID=1339210 RepID=A0A4R7C8W6_9HYPH|nr:hypothetical protein [Enterovirga rhinocerotis]TDR93147.1 hypothetical protein EV668_0401 [Enterovirga rhinocerotis]